jgi:hypothetical protein
MTLSSNNPLIESFTAYADGFLERKYMTFGSKLGVILDSNKVPVQNYGTDVDIATTAQSYIGVKGNAETVE